MSSCWQAAATILRCLPIVLWLAVEAVCILTYRSSEEEIVAEEEQNHEDDEADENAVDDAAGLACLACFAGLEFCLVLLVHGSKWSLCTQEGKGLRKGCS